MEALYPERLDSTCAAPNAISIHFMRNNALVAQTASTHRVACRVVVNVGLIGVLCIKAASAHPMCLHLLPGTRDYQSKHGRM